MHKSKWVVLPLLQDSNVTIQQVRQHWSNLMRSDRKHDLKAYHHLLYLALLHKDWRKAFTPISRPKMLANGRHRYDAAAQALGMLHGPYAETHVLLPFEGLITAEMLRALRAHLPKPAPDLKDRLPEAPYREAADDAA